MRCLLAGGCIAALEPVAERIGFGWCFGVYAILQASILPLIWRLETNGLKWRIEERERALAVEERETVRAEEETRVD